MDFQLSEDHLTTQKWVHEFAEREIRPVAPAYDEAEEFPWPVLKKAAEIGLYGLEFYMETLAADPTGLMFPICLEETCWGCAGISLGIWGSGLPLATLAYSGTQEQLTKWAPLMFGTVDDPKVGALCVTEPNAGSDVSALRTTARRDGDSWVLDGQKVFATNGGIARAAFEFARDYAKDRTAFGRPIIENQGIAFKLADMAMEIDAARLLTYRAAWLSRNGTFEHAEGSMSKLKAGETAVWVTEQA